MSIRAARLIALAMIVSAGAITVSLSDIALSATPNEYFGSFFGGFISAGAGNWLFIELILSYSGDTRTKP